MVSGITRGSDLPICTSSTCAPAGSGIVIGVTPRSVSVDRHARGDRARLHDKLALAARAAAGARFQSQSITSVWNTATASNAKHQGAANTGGCGRRGWGRHGGRRRWRSFDGCGADRFVRPAFAAGGRFGEVSP